MKNWCEINFTLKNRLSNSHTSKRDLTIIFYAEIYNLKLKYLHFSWYNSEFLLEKPAIDADS